MPAGFQTYIPVHALLKKHIAYFYTDVQEDTHFHRKYSFFPHVNTTLTFYKHATFAQSDSHNTVNSAKELPLLKLLTRQQHVTTVVQQGPIHKIGIVFSPLGLNHFIQEPYQSLATNEVQYFEPANDPEWSRQITACFENGDWGNAIQELEVFLTSLYRPKTYDELYRILEALNDPHNTFSIHEVAGQHFINHRKLNRDFKKELSITPEHYRMIARFRYAVQQKILHEHSGNLTSIAYESGYLDQSYMIRSFKKLTGLSPAAFFKEGKHLGMADTFWRIHNTKNVV